MFTPERHHDSAGTAPQLRIAAGTAIPTTTDTRKTAPQRAKPTKTTRLPAILYFSDENSCLLCAKRINRHGDPRRYLYGSPPVASASRRRARQTAPG